MFFLSVRIGTFPCNMDIDKAVVLPAVSSKRDHRDLSAGWELRILGPQEVDVGAGFPRGASDECPLAVGEECREWIQVAVGVVACPLREVEEYMGWTQLAVVGVAYPLRVVEENMGWTQLAVEVLGCPRGEVGRQNMLAKVQVGQQVSSGGTNTCCSWNP